MRRRIMKIEQYESDVFFVVLKPLMIKEESHR